MKRKTKLFVKAILLILSILGFVVFLTFVAIEAFNIKNNRIVYIKGHEYIESGIQYPTLIHSESCENESHKNE